MSRVTAGAAVALFASITLPMSQSAAETVLRLAENQPESNPVTVAMHRFADLVGEYTDGEVRVEVYSGAQLGQEPETIEQTILGIVDLARVNSVVLANVSPSMGVFTLPYIFRDLDHKYAVLDSDIGLEVREDLNDHGLIGFDFMEAGTRNFYVRGDQPVTSLEDLEGLLIRVQPAEISIRMVELLGAVPTPMNYGEVYSGLQTGVIDGAENDYVSYYTSGHYEVAPNYAEDGHLSPPAILLMNQARFEGLPEEHQEAILRAGHEAALFEREAMLAANEEARQAVLDAGVTITTLDNAPFREAVAPIYEEFPDLLPLIERIAAVE